MTPTDFTIEKTEFGLQYVIPGMERIKKSERPVFKADRTPAGDQLVIPGAETISTKEYLTRLAGKPLVPRRGQIGLRGAELFGS